MHDIAAKHDDAIEWKHFPRYWPFVRRSYWQSVDSPQKGQCRGSLLICAWTNVWDAGDWSRNHAHYDITQMTSYCFGNHNLFYFTNVFLYHTAGYMDFPCFGFMMTSSNGNIFRVTGHLCGEFTGDRWIPRPVANDMDLWCFLSSAPEWKIGWFDSPSHPLWRHSNVLDQLCVPYERVESHKITTSTFNFIASTQSFITIFCH